LNILRNLFNISTLFKPSWTYSNRWPHPAGDKARNLRHWKHGRDSKRFCTSIPIRTKTGYTGCIQTNWLLSRAASLL